MPEMSEVLFLVHRLPYPPDKGDKIRSYHLLQDLVRRHSVHLGCFVDDREDEKYLGEVEKLCASLNAVRLRPHIARVRSLSGFLSARALSLPYYYNKKMADWVKSTIKAKKITSIIAYSSPMAQYVSAETFGSYRRIMDFVDVDSDKWRRYAARARWPMSWVYKREASYLSSFERSVAKCFDASVFVTESEAEIFSELSPDTVDKHHVIHNGVETKFFDPKLHFENPFPADVLPVVFTGMMNYWSNIDGICWFVREVWPKIKLHESKAELWVVGASPTQEILRLESVEGVKVTGRVADIRPYLKYAALSVAPLRIAMGVQNKILEALAMGCTTVCTPQAASGLRDGVKAPVTVAETSVEMVDTLLGLLGSIDATDTGDAVRRYVLERYDWQANLERFALIDS